MRRQYLLVSLAVAVLAVGASVATAAREDDDPPLAALSGATADKIVLLLAPPEERDPCGVARPMAAKVAADLTHSASTREPFPGVKIVGYTAGKSCNELLANAKSGASPARQLAWLVAEYNAGTTRPVDVVALGGSGTIVAQMLEHMRSGDTTGWPGKVQIEDLVFIAPPFGGSTVLKARCNQNGGGPICDDLGRPVGARELLGSHDAGIDVTVVAAQQDDVVLPSSSSRLRVDHLVTYQTERTADGRDVPFDHDKLFADVAGQAALHFDHIGVKPGDQRKAPSVGERVAKALLFAGGEGDSADSGFETCIDRETGFGRVQLVPLRYLQTASGVYLAVYGRPNRDDDGAAADNIIKHLAGSYPPDDWPDPFPGAFPPGTRLMDALSELFATDEGRADLRVPTDEVPEVGKRQVLRLYLANMAPSTYMSMSELCDPGTALPSTEHHVAVLVNLSWAMRDAVVRHTLPHELVHVFLHSEAPTIGESPVQAPLQEGLAEYVAQRFAPGLPLEMAASDDATAEDPGFHPGSRGVEYGAWRLLARLRDRIGRDETSRDRRFMEAMKKGMRESRTQGRAGPAVRDAYNALALRGCGVPSGCWNAFEAVYQEHWHEALVNTLRGAETGLRLAYGDEDVRVVHERIDSVAWQARTAVESFGVSRPVVLQPDAGVRSVAYRIPELRGCVVHCVAVAGERRKLGIVVTNSSSVYATGRLEYLGCATARAVCLSRLCPELKPGANGGRSGDVVCGVWEFQADRDDRLIEYVALGDGFSTGPGLGDYDEDSLSKDPRSLCMRSRHSWPALLQPPSPGRAFRRWLFACRFAVLDDLTDHGVEAGLPAQMGRAQLNRDTDLVTLTIGMDDLDLRLTDAPAALVECLDLIVSPGRCRGMGRRHTDHELDEMRSDVDDAMPVFAARLDEVLRALERRVTSQTTIVLVGYPQLVDTDPGAGCAFTKLQIPRRNSRRELRFVHDAIEYINSVQHDIARERGVFFVPMEHYFALHEVCSALTPWIAGLTNEVFDRLTFKPVSPMPFGDGSFMPNTKGNTEFAVALRQFFRDELDRNPEARNPSGLPRNPMPTPASAGH